MGPDGHETLLHALWLREISIRHAHLIGAVTHIYDKAQGKIYDVELHRPLRKVREDLAAGRPVWVPKRKAQTKSFRNRKAWRKRQQSPKGATGRVGGG